MQADIWTAPICNRRQLDSYIDWVLRQPSAADADHVPAPAPRAIDLGDGFGASRRVMLPAEVPAALLVVLMALVMQTRQEESGVCEEADLVRAGFLPDEIAQHRDAALRQALARQAGTELRRTRVHRVPAGRFWS